jgi:hypothetical protein
MLSQTSERDPAVVREAMEGGAVNPGTAVETVVSSSPCDGGADLGGDGFWSGGFRHMASNMIALAIRDVMRGQPGASALARLHADLAVDWIKGNPPGALSFEDCCHALGLEDWTQGLRDLIFERPDGVSEAFRDYERHYAHQFALDGAESMADISDEMFELADLEQQEAPVRSLPASELDTAATGLDPVWGPAGSDASDSADDQDGGMAPGMRAH